MQMCISAFPLAAAGTTGLMRPFCVSAGLVPGFGNELGTLVVVVLLIIFSLVAFVLVVNW